MAEQADRAFREEMLAPLGGVSIRRMFGGLGLFREGLMFGLVANGDLYLTALPDERAAFAAEGGAPFSPEMGGRTATMISYWRAPDRLGDEPGECLTWAPRLRGGAGPRGGEADRTAEVEPPGRMIRTRGDPGALPPPSAGRAIAYGTAPSFRVAAGEPGIQSR